jgi:hypothetical protein
MKTTVSESLGLHIGAPCLLNLELRAVSGGHVMRRIPVCATATAERRDEITPYSAGRLCPGFKAMNFATITSKSSEGS